ncbi:MAG: hypothetical protein KGI79_02960 [Patescibacteria group bacterium]|nr:hypothetical protein [Patescibacteria group bacterium]MDE2116809.1 hypothetical protein [Patescibacteria group bacterium]
MARNPMQDIVPKGKSIRNIPLPEARTKTEIRKQEKEIAAREQTLRKDIETKQEAEAKLEEDIEAEQTELDQEKGRKEELRRARLEFEAKRARNRRGSSRSRKYTVVYGVGALVALVALGFIVTAVFRGATVTVTPHTLAFTANSDMSAKQDDTSGGLPYQLIVASTTASETIPASGQKQVSTKASGVIVVYNNYSSTPQRLVANTRFQTPEGLIYRIDKPITVPGKSGSTPGSVEAIVYADQPGTNYNVGLKDFTIPGFEGDPRYKDFYARSKTPLAGGFVGTQSVISESDRAKAVGDIQSRLATALLAQAQAQVSSSDILFDKAYTIDYQALPDQNSTASQTTIVEEGAIYATAFNTQQLSEALASSYVPGYKNEPIAVQNMSALTFTPTAFHPDTNSSISFHLSGTSTFEWLFDAGALKNALAGKPRSQTQNILQNFPMIEKADISIRPFWTSTFPSADRITIKKAM